MTDDERPWRPVTGQVIKSKRLAVAFNSPARTSVLVIMHFDGGALDGAQGWAWLKSSAEVDFLIEALRKRRDAIWPQEPDAPA